MQTQKTRVPAAPLLGAVADDFTGATDLASTLVKGGMRSVQVVGVPTREEHVPECDALVVSLKSRTAPTQEACAESAAALAWLRRQGCRQFFFKYCSTFDSTDSGNIGPVADTLLRALDADFAFVCPAFPANGRTVYQGHLFIGSALLNESGMENHPLTPMRDANLVRVLGRQTPGGVGLIALPIVAQGASAIIRRAAALRAEGVRYAVVDALTERDLVTIGEAAAQHPLVTGASGIALGLPANFRRLGLLAASDDQAAAALPPVAGHAAVLAGSCSRATRAQIEASPYATLHVDPLRNDDPEMLVRDALAWAEPRLGGTPIVIAASAPPERVAALQAKLGRTRAGALVEGIMADIAQGLVERGVRRLVIAGGETAGAIVVRLGIDHLRIGSEIAPGVPWTLADDRSAPLLLALKSGNFGGRDFFRDAFAATPAGPADGA